MKVTYRYPKLTLKPKFFSDTVEISYDFWNNELTDENIFKKHPNSDYWNFRNLVDRIRGSQIEYSDYVLKTFFQGGSISGFVCVPVSEAPYKYKQEKFVATDYEMKQDLIL